MEWIINNGFGLFATIVGILGALGGAAGYFKASRGDSIIKYQATEIGLRDGKIANLEKDLAKVTEQCASKDNTIEEQKKHINYLQKLGQGSPQLKRLTTATENNTKQTENNTATVASLVKVVEAVLTNKEEKK
jgi:hypothetical protein